MGPSAADLVVASSSAFGLFVVALFVLHVAVSTFLLRADPPRLTSGQAGDFEWHVFVPALNEAAVLDASLHRLASMPERPHVWIIDDASDDDTGAIAQRWAERNDRIHLVSRRFPAARQGKGMALNAAYRELLDWQSTRANPVHPMRVIVGIVDADGLLDPNTFSVLAGEHCFGTADVGAVQQDVWMSNSNEMRPFPQSGRIANHCGATLLRLQDVEFRASIAAIQHARHFTGSVAMGGNGQWTRLEALDDIVRLDLATSRVQDHGPWHGALLEDYELGVHLLLTGWETRFTPGCYVAQEAVPALRAYIRQRTRWCQGSMQCARYLPHMWRNAFIGPWALIESMYYLAQPWFWILGTFLFPIPMIEAAQAFFRSPQDWWGWVLHDSGWMWLSMVILLAVGPLSSWSFTYRAMVKRSGQQKPARLQSIHDGLAYVVLVNLSYIIAWRSLLRLLRRRTGWAKTARVGQLPVPHAPHSPVTQR
jgi:1,2-diacylglycerol 3-beta-glucosyltransferase